MGRGAKRLTLVVTPEIAAQMKSIKREKYFDCTQSDMIRELIAAGVRSCRTKVDRGCAERENA